MKKLFFGIIAIVIAITGICIFAGCEKEEDFSITNPTLACDDATCYTAENSFFDLEEDELHNPLYFIGKLHNQAMEFIIHNANQEALSTPFLFEEEIKHLSYDFIYSIGWSCEEMNDIPEIVLSIDAIDRLTDEQKQQWYNLQSEVLIHLNPEELCIVQDLISNFNEEIRNIPDEEQQTILYIASSVLYSSFSYWTQEFEKEANSAWFGNLYDENGLCYAPLSQKSKEDIIEADALGAATGAVKGGIKGAAGGSVIPGAGTLTGFIAGALVEGLITAAESSAATAIVRKIQTEHAVKVKQQ